MMALQLLQDPAVLALLQAAQPVHVVLLLPTQRLYLNVGWAQGRSGWVQGRSGWVQGRRVKCGGHGLAI